MSGGIFSKVNNALPTGVRNYLPPGMHRIQIIDVKMKTGTHKNTGKEFFIVEGKVLATSVKDNANCQPGSTISTGFNTAQYPDSAASDIKAFLLSQFSEEDLANAPRNLLQPNEVQQHSQENPNPYVNGQVGITWQEALRMVCYREESLFKDRIIDCEAVDKPTKSGGHFTKVYWKAPGTIKELGNVGLTS